MNLLRGRARRPRHVPGRRRALAAEPRDSRGRNLPRLSDHVRFTNGLSGQPAIFCRASRLLLAMIASRRALGGCVSGPLLPSGGRPCYNGRMLTGGKKTASGPLVLKREAARVRRATGRAGDRARRRCGEQEALQRETTRARRRTGAAAPAAAIERERTPSLDHDMRRAPKRSIAPIRGFPWRASNWNG